MGTVPVSATFSIKRKARRPYLRVVVTDQNGDAFDFTGASSTLFQMYDYNGVEIVSAAGEIVSPATSGILRYAWADGDTDIAGEFRAEFDVVYPTGGNLTVPVRGNILINIFEDLNNA